jgi:hypothetical protein
VCHLRLQPQNIFRQVSQAMVTNQSQLAEWKHLKSYPLPRFRQPGYSAFEELLRRLGIKANKFNSDYLLNICGCT